jgi:hypothetical protein
MTYIFPGVLTTFMLLAAAVYGWDGDWKRLAYWVLAAGITVVVTL